MLRTAAGVGLLLLLAQVQPPGRPVGVLVGVHHRGNSGDPPPIGPANPEPISAGRLRTIWIPVMDPSTAGSIPATELPDLLLPRRSGFWRAGLLGTCAEAPHLDVDDKVLGTETEIADYLWMAPAGRQPQVRLDPRDRGEPPERVGPCAALDTYCDIDRRTTVFWVWPEYISLELGTTASCGAHEGWSPGFTVRRPEDLEAPVSIGEALGPSADRRFQRAFASAVKDPDHEDCGEPAVYDSNSWHIERQPGGWKAEGWSTTHRLCGYGIDFTVDPDLTRVTGRKDDRARWPPIKARMPQLTDAHFSPDGRWILAVTEKALLLIEASASDRPVARIAVSDREDVIMVEWASGPNVARWAAEVHRVTAAGPLQPLVLRRQP